MEASELPGNVGAIVVEPVVMDLVDTVRLDEADGEDEYCEVTSQVTTSQQAEVPDLENYSSSDSSSSSGSESAAPEMDMSQKLQRTPTKNQDPFYEIVTPGSMASEFCGTQMEVITIGGNAAGNSTEVLAEEISTNMTTRLFRKRASQKALWEVEIMDMDLEFLFSDPMQLCAKEYMHGLFCKWYVFKDGVVGLKMNVHWKGSFRLSRLVMFLNGAYLKLKQHQRPVKQQFCRTDEDKITVVHSTSPGWIDLKMGHIEAKTGKMGWGTYIHGDQAAKLNVKKGNISRVNMILKKIEDVCDTREEAIAWIRQQDWFDMEHNKIVKIAMDQKYIEIEPHMEVSDFLPKWQTLPQKWYDVMGTHSLYIQGPSGIGKTELIAAHFAPKAFLFMNSKEDVKKLKAGHRGIIMDDPTRTGWSFDELFAFVCPAHNRSLSVKFGSVCIPAGLPRLIVTNKEPEEFFNQAGCGCGDETWKALLGRLAIIRLKLTDKLFTPPEGWLDRQAGSVDLPRPPTPPRTPTQTPKMRNEAKRIRRKLNFHSSFWINLSKVEADHRQRKDEEEKEQVAQEEDAKVLKKKLKLQTRDIAAEAVKAGFRRIEATTAKELAKQQAKVLETWNGLKPIRMIGDTIQSYDEIQTTSLIKSVRKDYEGFAAEYTKTNNRLFSEYMDARNKDDATTEDVEAARKAYELAMESAKLTSAMNLHGTRMAYRALVKAADLREEFMSPIIEGYQPKKDNPEAEGAARQKLLDTVVPTTIATMTFHQGSQEEEEEDDHKENDQHGTGLEILRCSGVQQLVSGCVPVPGRFIKGKQQLASFDRELPMPDFCINPRYS